MHNVTTAGGIVYLLHFARPFTRAGHYLGLCATERDIGADSATIPHGAGERSTAAAGAQIADVWEAETVALAGELYERLRRQGSRKRLCSVCSPGNGRGGGRGNYTRKPK